MSDEAREASVLVIGRGRLGRSLAGALTATGTPAQNVSMRDEPALDAALAEASLVVVAVPDGAILEVAEELARRRVLGGRAVAHLSGAAPLAVLEPCARVGCPIGSLHPLQPFSAERPPEAFVGIAIGVAASSPALRERLHALAHRLGSTPLDVADEHRALYHAAGHQASAFLVVLVAQAQAMLAEIGWDEQQALAALLPAIQGTLDNLRAQGLPGALSGPFRRGDLGTVEGHLRALGDLEAAPEIEAAYRALAVTAVQLAIGTGLAPERAARLSDLLE